MNIKTTNTLTEEEKIEIKELEKVCNKAENLESEAFLSNEINFNKNILCFYLGYEENNLVAFLTTFMPDKNEAEITAFTHPDYRRKGCFKELLEKSTEILRKSKVSNILLLIEVNGKSGKEVLKTFKDAKWVRSEYTLSNKNKVIVPVDKNLRLELVTKENKDICLNIINEIFKMEEGDNDNFIQNAIDASDREAYIVYDNEVLIGTFNLNFKENKVFIYGLGIAPDYQKKGYGKKMLKHVLNIAFEKGDKAVLDVDSDNPSAYNLYIHNGFGIDFQIDYFGYSLFC